MAGWLIAVVAFVVVVTPLVVVYLYNSYRMNLVKLHFVLSLGFCGLNNYFSFFFFGKLKLHKSLIVNGDVDVGARKHCKCFGNLVDRNKIVAALFMTSKWSPMTLAENPRVSHKFCYK